MRQASRVDEVGVASEHRSQVAANLRALQGMREPGPGKVPGPGSDDLGLGREPAQRGAVQYPGTVPLERGTVRPLGRLRRPPLGVRRAVPGMLAALTAMKRGHITH
jgi:hypothetical protein